MTTNHGVWLHCSNQFPATGKETDTMAKAKKSAKKSAKKATKKTAGKKSAKKATKKSAKKR